MTDPLSKDQIFIGKVTEIILTNLKIENFGVKELARESGMSHYSLSKKLYSTTRKTANQFIREVRLEQALQMLRSEDITASEVAYRVGFGSPGYFNKCFHKRYGYPPGKFKKGDLNNWKQDTLTEIIAENKLKKTVWESYILSFPGILIFAILLGMTVFFVYSKINIPKEENDLVSSDGRISLAVMPFRNMTNDTTLNIWQDGIQDMLINSLSNSEELRVKQIESIRTLIRGNGITNYVAITPSVAGAISQKLNADIFINGSIKQSFTTLRVDAQLINAKTEEVYKSFQINGDTKNILNIIDSLSVMVRNYLLISKLKKENIEFQAVTSTNSPEAYMYYIMGKNAYFNLSSQTAIKWLNQACAIDTNFTWAMWFLTITYQDFGSPEQAKKWAVKLFRRKDSMQEREKLWVSYKYAEFFQLPEAIKYLRQLEEYDNQSPAVYIALGWTYFCLEQYDNAIQEYEKAFKIYKKWGSKSELTFYSSEVVHAYLKAGQYNKAKKILRKAEKDFPDSYQLIYNQAFMLLADGHAVEADSYITKYISLCKKNSISEVETNTYLAVMYSELNILDTADAYFRQALDLEPENPESMNNLAFFLIDKNRNLTEGMKIVNRALEISPENYNSLHTLGWGKFKLGQYKDALFILQKSWDLRMEKAMYNYKAFLHLEAAKKAIGKDR